MGVGRGASACTEREREQRSACREGERATECVHTHAHTEQRQAMASQCAPSPEEKGAALTEARPIWGVPLSQSDPRA